jgi:hypothetical protein
MQLLEFRKLFVEATGHWELVTDYNGADYTDNGADKYIRGGQKILDRWLPSVSGQRVSTRVLVAGNNYITVSGLRFVDTLHYKDPDTGEWCRLTRKTPSEMFAFAPKRENETAGAPQYWMRDYRQSVAAQGLRNGSFSQGLANWATLTGTPSVSAGGVLTLDANGASANDAIYQHLGDNMMDDQEVTVVVDSIEAGAIFYVLLLRWNDPTVIPDPNDPEVYVSHAEAITSAGTYTFSAGEAWNAVVLLIAADQSQAVAVSSITLVGAITPSSPETDTPTLVFDRPADVDYTVEVRGGNYASNLVFDNDESYWSTEEVDLLLEASILELESIYHRNTTGVNDRLATLQMKVQSLYYDICQHEQGGTPEDMRLGV